MKEAFRIEQFKKFYDALIIKAPKGYKPWFIPVTKDNKAIDGRVVYRKAPNPSCCGVEWKTIRRANSTTKTICKSCGRTRGSWKQPWACLNFQEAVELIKQGYNIGLVARKGDPLIIIDIDNFSYAGFLPDTLISKSRKRCGLHGFYWHKGNKEISNIPTEDNGEVRCQDQYVLVPGSYVPTTKEEIEKEFTEGHITEKQKEQILQDELLGFYTIDTEKNPRKISLEELPAFFLEEKEKQDNAPKIKSDAIKPSGKYSALFDLTIKNIISIDNDKRVGHPLHASDTSANFSVSSDDPNISHCWRHNVSLNALQFLVVKSGYMDCVSAGTGHKGTNPSAIVGDYGAIFHAWMQAKKDGFLPEYDPIPVKALIYIARKHRLVEPGFEGMLPSHIYNKTLNILEREY